MYATTATVSRYTADMRRRWLFVVLVSFIVGAGVAIGCGDDNGTPGTISNSGGPDAAADRRASSGGPGDPTPSDDDDFAPTDDDDDVVVDKDAGKKADADAGKTANERDAAGPGKAGDECSFNWDCQLGLRCECDGLCACKTGARGTTKPGATCTSGNDCISAVCLDGPSTDQLCSDECKTPGDPAPDCPTLLPKCQDVAFVGRICTREPPP